MYSLNINYIFDKIYDGLLFLKYFWYFNVLGYDNDKYLAEVKGEIWDGLRDRHWLDQGLISSGTDKASEIMSGLGLDVTRDSDGDGVPDVKDLYPYDSNNFSNEKIKEIFSADLSWTDKIRDTFGIPIKDSDGDGIPDSVEALKGTNPLNMDSDADGITDGEEIYKHMNPNNPDVDGDGVIDGRDAYPLDKYRSIFENDVDTDGDGVSDRFEKMLGSDPYHIDTDGDGLRDGIDPHPSIAESKLYVAAGAFDTITNGLTFAIQNKFLAFLSDALSVLSLFVLPLTILVFLKWYWEIKKAVDHYYHLFHGAYGYKEAFGHSSHDYLHDLKGSKGHGDSTHHVSASHGHDSTSHSDHHITSAPVGADYLEHPKWAIVKSYFAEDSQVFWRMGIIEADAMLDDVLGMRGALGATLSDKLKSSRLVSINDAWEAHKVRNRISHEGSNYHLSERDARLTYNAYERVFTELGVI